MNLKQYIFWAFCFSYISSCQIDKWDLDDKSNELIPNYSLSLDGLDCTSSFNTNIFPVGLNSFVTAVESADNNIKIIKITETLIDEKWSIKHEVVWDMGRGELIGFGKEKNQYYLSFKENDQTEIVKMDSSFNTVSSFKTFEQFIDTSYNDITSVSFQKMVIDTSDGLYLIGQLSSFSKKYSCLMKMGNDLKPLFVKTYFEDDTIQSLLPLDRDRFIVLNQRDDEMALISDNVTGSLYRKYDLTFNESFYGANLLQSNGKLYLTGSITSGTGKTIEISLDNKNAFISDVKNYEVLNIASQESSRNSVLLSGVTSNGSEKLSFLAEYKDKNYLWCNSYSGFNFIKSLAVTEARNVGLVYLFLVESNGSYFLHVLRTDEEGATIENPFDLNCI